MRKISVLLVILSFVFCGTIFATEGDVIWTRTHNGPDDKSDYGYGIAVDGNGNVYVTGHEYKSDTERSNIWVRKYDANGYEVWTSTYNGVANDYDYGRGIAVDGSGNVYVTGYEWVSGAKNDIWVGKYDSGGDEVWTETHNGPDNYYDEGYGIVVDGDGNVYVTGREYYDAVEGYNIWVRKYDSDGEEVWTETHNGPADGSDVGRGIAVDGRGNVYVIGYEEKVGDIPAIWIRKYDSDGDEVWTRTYDADGESARGNGIAVDDSGNVYVTGYEYIDGQENNIWVRKYDSNGNVVWTRTYNGAEDVDDGGYGIAVDGSGNVYVTGDEWVTGEQNNNWVRKYDSDGDVVWTKTHNGPANEKDRSFGIAVDGSGNVYVTGCETVTGESQNIWVRKYEGAYGEHFEPPVEGNVKIQGGEKGYVNPKKGEKAKIHFQPSGAGRVNVKIYTLRGLLVWEGSKSVSGVQDFIEWNCRNKENDVVASGIYVVYVKGPGIKATKKVAILK